MCRRTKPQMFETNAQLRPRIVTGVIAGLVGGALIDAYSFVAIFVLTGTLNVVREYQYTAASFLGPSALGSASAAWFGVAAHFAISIAWGLGYVYVAARRPQLGANALLSGFVYGTVVYLLALLFNLAAGTKNAPEMTTLGNALIGHTVFFGIPIALIARARRDP